MRTSEVCIHGSALKTCPRERKAPSPMHYGEVTVIFCDIVGFTALADRVAPKHLVEVLNEIFSALDQLAASCHVEKVKTIGDAYMGISGTTDQDRDSAHDAADFALQAQRVVTRSAIPGTLSFRIGMHTGSLIGGVVGHQNLAYDYWGGGNG